MENDKPKVNIDLIYNYSNDLAETRRFYTDLMGMDEVAYDEEYNYLRYRVEGLQVVFFGAEEKIPIREGYAVQPGWDGGTLEASSWAVNIVEGEYAGTVKRLQKAGVKSFDPNPTWVHDSYWSFAVLDPMGNTIELTMVPAQKPENVNWGK